MTEDETEYMVQCVKHVFEEHVLFQFTVNNTVEDQLLEQLSVVSAPQSMQQIWTGLRPDGSE